MTLYNGNPELKRRISNKKKFSVGASGSSVTVNASEFAISARMIAIALLAAAPQLARAASECGADGAGQDTLTCSAASYATGITYTNSNGLTLNLNNPSMRISGAQGVSLQSGVGPVNPQLTVNVTNVDTITTTGSAVLISNAGVGGLASINLYGGTLTTTGAATTVSATGTQTTSNAQVMLTGGQILNTGTGGGIIASLTGIAGTGNATVTITGGTIQTSGTAVQSAITGGLRRGTSSVIMSGGSVLSSGVNGTGLWARHTGTGLSQVQMSGGTVAATGNNGDGILVSINSGTYAVDVSSGTVTGGSGFGAAIHTSGAGGGTVNIGAGAVINATGSGVALRDGDLNRDGVDEIGGNSVITTAGTLNGAIVLGGGTDTVTVTGGAINGNITGDGADALNFNLGTNSFTHGAAYAISGMDAIVMNSGFVRLDSTVAANTLSVKGGMLVLGNTATFAGATTVEGGTLAVNGTLNGTVIVNSLGRLQGSGRVGSTSVAGTIAPGNSIGTLLVAGNYQGNSGTLEIEGVFAGTGSSADRLVITGNATGTTTVRVINMGGTGALTGSGNTDGISIVQVGGTSTANAFQLAGGYAAVGPYQYQLRMFGSTSSAASQADPLLGAVPFYDYRLQSVVDASGKPVAVPQIAGYQALPTGAVRYGASLLDSVHKRQGELRQLGTARDQNGGTQNDEFFLRAQGSRSNISGDRASGYGQNMSFVQGGGNLFGRDIAGGAKWRIGGAFAFGESMLNADASSAKVNLHGTTLALTSTYQMAGGGYVDGVIQATRYASDIKTSERGQTGSPKGWGYGVSLETGVPFEFSTGAVVEPQAQISYQKIKFDTFTDIDSIAIDLQNRGSLRGRFGGRIQQTFIEDQHHLWSPFIEVNLMHEFLGGGGINASGVRFASDSLGSSVQLSGGVNVQLGINRSVFASMSYEKGLGDEGANSLSGNIGLRLSF